MEQVYKEAVVKAWKHEVNATKAIPSKQSQYQHLHKN